MKKFFALILAINMIMIFSACSNRAGTGNLPDKEGIAPYQLSENDTYLLQTLDLEGDVNIVSFKAPTAAKSLKAEVHVLENDGTWNTVGRLQILLGADATPDARLEGTFAMLLKDDYSIDMHINTMGRASYQTEAFDIDYEIISSAKCFLADFQKIELNKEIPVAIMIYDRGTSMRSYSMDSFYSPSEFEGMDLVQVVTLTFMDTVD